MTHSAVKQGRSNGFESQRQDIVGGSWYAPVRTHEKVDYTGVEAIGYRALRSLPVINGHTRWEIECVTCHLKKPVDAHVFRDALAVGETRRLHACIHPDVPLSAGAVRDEYQMAPATLRTMIAVLTHEKVYGRGVLRLDLAKLLKRDPDSMPLVKKGWLLSEGMPQRLSSTEKARKALGVTL